MYMSSLPLGYILYIVLLCIIIALHYHYVKLFNIGCNSFVTVKYDKNAATFSCIFKDTNNVTGKIACIICYSQCGNSLRKKLEAESTEESPNQVLLQLPSDSMDYQSLCYNITATNGVQTVIVEGCIDDSE